MERTLLGITFVAVNFGLFFSYVGIGTTKPIQHKKLEPPLYSLDARYVEMVTLGHEELYEHFLAEWVVHVLYDRTLPMEAVDEVVRVMDGIIAWAPRLEAPYIFGCAALFDIFQAMHRCEPILQAGIRNAKG